MIGGLNKKIKTISCRSLPRMLPLSKKILTQKGQAFPYQCDGQSRHTSQSELVPCHASPSDSYLFKNSFLFAAVETSLFDGYCLIFCKKFHGYCLVLLVDVCWIFYFFIFLRWMFSWIGSEQLCYFIKTILS